MTDTVIGGETATATAATAAAADTLLGAAAAATAAPTVGAETKAEGEAATAAAGDKAAAPGAPETYEPFTFGEHKLEGDLAKEFGSLAKERNLSQADAQKFADLGMKLNKQMADANVAILTKAKDEWASASRADKEFGGPKPVFEANIGIANKALNQFGTPELRKILNESGLGSHPEVLRLLYRAGKSISEDTIVAGGQATSGARSDAAMVQQLYPTMSQATH